MRLWFLPHEPRSAQIESSERVVCRERAEVRSEVRVAQDEASAEATTARYWRYEKGSGSSGGMYCQAWGNHARVYATQERRKAKASGAPSGVKKKGNRTISRNTYISNKNTDKQNTRA